MSTELISSKKLAKHAGWPVGRIRNLIAKGEIRHVRIGGGFYLPKTAIEDYLAEHMVEPAHALDLSAWKRDGKA
jgi:excisionase family DNA binding protein